MVAQLSEKITKPGRFLRWHWSIYLALFVVSALISVYALRQNNLTMIRLRDAVYTTDKKNGDIETALSNLRAYVYGHMNTDLSSGGNAIKPPIQLKYTYQRLVAAEKSRIGAINAKVYSDAQAYCERLNPASFSGRSRVPCIQDYVSRNGIKEKSIPDALYKFDFVSPAWSLDVAGWSLVVGVVLFIVFATNLLFDKWVHSTLRQGP